MSYRPITDVWILARPKVPYYGAYPSGFLQRARSLLGISSRDPLLHVCGGHARKYSLPEFGVAAGVGQEGFGRNDQTLDIDPACEPDFVCDVRGGDLPAYGVECGPVNNGAPVGWPAILADPPYTAEDSARYAVDAFPPANDLLRACLAAVRIGGRVGFLHYVWPQPPKTARSVACVGVIVGFNNRMRCYSVFERTT